MKKVPSPWFMMLEILFWIDSRKKSACNAWFFHAFLSPLGLKAQGLTARGLSASGHRASGLSVRGVKHTTHCPGFFLKQMFPFPNNWFCVTPARNLAKPSFLCCMWHFLIWVHFYADGLCTFFINGELHAPGLGERVCQWTSYGPNLLTAALSCPQKVLSIWDRLSSKCLISVIARHRHENWNILFMLNNLANIKSKLLFFFFFLL